MTYSFHIKSGAALAQERAQIDLMQRVRDIGALAVASIQPPPKPFYKKPWFWGVVASAVVAVAGVTIYTRR